VPFTPPAVPPADPTIAPSFELFVGPEDNELEVVEYVRSQLGDEAGTEFSDEVFVQAVQEVVLDFSRHKPVDVIVGDPVLNTSPLMTVENQRLYLLDSTHGFDPPVMMVTDVLYRAAGYLSNISEYSYMSMMAMSPMSRFFATPYAIDSPTTRLLIEQYANEANKWGIGYWQKQNTVDGLAIEVLPIPQSGGLPIFIRYWAAHTPTAVNDSDHYYTVPQVHERDFALLLQAAVLERAGMRALRRGTLLKTGLNSRTILAREILDEVTWLRTRAYTSLGGHNLVGMVND